MVGAPDEEEDEEPYLDTGVQPGDGKLDGASSVASVVSSTCSTAPVRGLSLQIAEELRCMSPGLLVPFAATRTIRFASAAVLPYLEAETAEALLRAAPEVGTVTINSGLRSVAQQYLLHSWQRAGRCGIRVAATPGRSNHETGRAVDLANSAEARTEMLDEAFSPVRRDPVHFDHLASPDLRSLNVEAFQRLWNRNHSDDAISEDGLYGSETATRLARSPAGGFAVGSTCAP
jgi:hypothetical protein